MQNSYPASFRLGRWLRPLAVAGLLACGATASAQTLNYSTLNTNNLAGTYTDLGTTGSVITTTNFDDSNSAAQTMPFAISYNGSNFSSFVLNTNGYLRLGSTGGTFPYFPNGAQDTSGGPLNGTDNNLVLPFNADLEAGTGIPEYRMATTGSAGSRVLTVQWKNMSDKARIASTTNLVIIPKQFANMSFQVKFYEGTGQIDFVYGPTTGTANVTTALFTIVGLKGTGAVTTSVVAFTKTSASLWSAATPQAGPFAAGVNAFNVRNAVTPDAGRTYRFFPSVAVDATVTALYGFDQLVVPAGQPVILRASVRNAGTAALNNLQVSLNVSGANSASVSSSIATLAAGDYATVIFPAISVPTLGNNTVIVSVPPDGNTGNPGNNSMSMAMVTNSTTTSYITPGLGPATSYGFNSGSDNYFAAKITLNQARDITAVNAYVSDDVTSTTLGQTLYAVVVDATSGAILGRSVDFVATAGTVNQVHSFVLSTPVTVGAGDVLVGMAQVITSANYFPMGVQTENPNRGNSFFTGSATSPTTPLAAVIPYKYMLEAVTAAPSTYYNLSNTALTACSGTLYDSGGPSANYPDNTGIVQLITPATSGTLARLTFSQFSLEDGADYLTVYDGANTSAPVIGTYTGTSSPGTVTATNAAGQLTLAFNSNATGNFLGFAATISCAAPPLQLTGRTPASNAVNAPITTSLGLTFSAAPTVASLANVRVFGTQALGQRTLGTATVSGTTATLPIAGPAFKPGENVAVTVPATVVSNAGTAAAPYVFQFTTATTASSGRVGAAVNYATGVRPSDIALGDVTGDGRSDIVLVNQTSNTVSVLPGLVGGAFGARLDYTANNSPYLVTLGDVTGDGRLDVVATNGGNNSVSVFVGVAGGLGTRTDYLVTAIASGVALGDLNADGRLDMVVTNAGPTTAPGSTVSVFLNLGGGTFGAPTDYTTGLRPSSASIGDVNLDGRLDLVITNESSNTVSVLRNQGNGTFSAKVDYATGAVPFIGTIGDLNGDGRLDIVTCNQTANTSSVLLGTTSGTFSPKIDYTTGTSPQDIDLADMNGDGRLDIVTANATANTVSILLGTGAGTFGPKQDFVTDAGPVSTALGDINDDGRLDLVTTNIANTSSVLLGLPLPTITSFTPAGGPVGTAVTITGTNFTGATSLTLGGVSIFGFVVVNATTITFTVPAGAVSGLISVTTPVGTATSSSNFAVTVAQLAVTQNGTGYANNGTAYIFASQILGTTSAPVSFTLANAGSAPLSISNIATTGNFALSGTIPTAVTANGSTTVAVTFAPTAAGTQSGTLVITSALGTYTVNLRGNGQYAVPTIGGIAPATGPVGSTVTVTGSGFVAGSTTVTLGGTVLTGIVVSNNGTTITFVVPAGATAGAVVVTTPGGTVTGTGFCVQYTPGTTPASRCGAGTLILSASGAPVGGSYAYYNAATGGTAIAGIVGASYTTPSLSATTTYYVAISTGTGTTACEGPRTPVVATINAVPVVTVAANGPLDLCAGGSVTLTASGASNYVWSTGASTASIIVSTAGTYAVTGTSTAGCSATSATTSVTVTPLPTAPAATPASRCGTGTVTLAASGAPVGGSYAWYTAATGGTAIAAATTASYTTPSLTATTTYYVSALSSGGCEGPRTAVVALVNIAPTVTIAATGPLNFCAGGSVTLTASGADTYLWSTGDTTPGITVSTSGSYTVIGTTAAGCSATSAATAVTATPLPAAPTVTAASSCGPGTVTLAASGAPAGGSYAWYTTATGGSAITGATTASYTTPSLTATTTYYVSTLNSGGCEGPRTAVTAIINAVPAVSIAAVGALSFCQGGSVTLTASGADTYLWSNGATTASITVSASGSYTVVGTVTTGCTATSAATTVTVEPTPATPTITQGPVGTLTSSAITGNQWYIGGVLIPGAVNPTYVVPSAAQNGVYTVIATSATGCASAISAPQTVTLTATATATLAGAVQVYPNPAHRAFTLTLPARTSAISAILFNAVGQMVRQLTVPATASQTEFDVTGLATGVYLLQVRVNGLLLNRRVIVE